MTTILTLIRYKKRFIPMALSAMVLHRFMLMGNKKISFYKLMGSGKNGSFDKTPDYQQWAILTVHPQAIEDTHNINKLYKSLYGQFIAKWFIFFKCTTTTYVLNAIEGHGFWDGKKVFGNLPHQSNEEGRIAVLTRATIRLSQLNQFWKNVDAVATQMATSKGFITSYGIGEMPWIKQATFSIWENKQAMLNFAYQNKAHKEVIQKTQQQKWYTEEMFVRFTIHKILKSEQR